MITRNHHGFAAAALAVAPLIFNQASAVIVDWLEIAPGANSSSFSLTNDSDIAVVSATISLASGFADVPRPFLLGQNFWTEDSPLTIDSQLANPTVPALEFFATNVTTPVSYDITFNVPSGIPLYLAIGGLYRDATHNTGAITISSSNPGTSIVLTETLLWGNDFNSLSQELTWNGSTLSTSATANGESRVAFFEISSIGGSPPSLKLSISDSSGLTFGGDPFVIGLGVGQIPEPTTAILVLLAGSFCLRRRVTK